MFLVHEQVYGASLSNIQGRGGGAVYPNLCRLPAYIFYLTFVYFPFENFGSILNNEMFLAQFPIIFPCP